MKIFTLLILSLSLSLNSFGFEDEMQEEELSAIDHEMFLGCVSTKSECKVLAHHEGLAFLKAVKDATRCPQRPKSLACIVQH